MGPMKKQRPAGPVERLFPFVLRSRALLVGFETLQRSKSQLHFVLIPTDISDAKKAEVLAEFAHYPVVQRFTAQELEKHFGSPGAKVLGFRKSHLAQSIYGELKENRLNQPPAAKSSAAPQEERQARPEPNPKNP
jgi:hypothetical protein